MEETGKHTDRARLQRLLPWALAAALAVVLGAHATSVPGGFTWLDHGDVEAGRALSGRDGPTGLFVKPFGTTGFYRPLVALSLSFDQAVWGGRPAGFHLTNVLLHGAACAAFALFFRTWWPGSGSLTPAAVVVAGVHPLAWLPAGSISHRPELLATLFSLTSAVLFLRAARSGKSRDALLSAGVFLLALWSKESSAVWVPGLAAAGLLLDRKEGRPPADSAALFGAMGAAVLVYGAMRIYALPGIWGTSFPSAGVWEAIGTRLSAFGSQLGFLLRPTLPPLSDATPLTHALAFPALGVLLVLSAGAWLAWRAGLQSPWTRVVLFTGIALAPALNLVPLPRLTSPHYGYLAGYGVGAASALCLGPGSLRGLRTALMGLWAATALASTAAGGTRFRNDETLFGPETAADPAYREGWAYLGDRRRRAGDLKGAVDAYERALSAAPGIAAYVDWRTVCVNLAEIRLREGDDEEAESLLGQSAEGAPPHLRDLIDYDLALVSSARGDDAGVVRRLDGRPWDRAEPVLLLARSLGRLGREREARAALARARPLLTDEQRARLDARVVPGSPGTTRKESP